VITESKQYWLNTDGRPVPKKGKGDRLIKEITLMGAQSLTNLDRYGRYDAAKGVQACKVIFIQSEGKMDYTTHPRIEVDRGRMLRVSVKGKDPKFKVLLYPYEHRVTPMPKINFTEDGNVLIEIKGQKDAIGFTDGSEGRTHISIERMGSAAVQKFNF
jgi:hypothetical protein